MYIYVHISMRKPTRARTHADTYTRISILKPTRAHVHTHTCTHADTYTREHARTYGPADPVLSAEIVACNVIEVERVLQSQFQKNDTLLNFHIG